MSGPRGPAPISDPSPDDRTPADWDPVRWIAAPPPRRLRRGASSPRAFALAGLLFAATFFTTTTLGAFWAQVVRTDVTTDLLPWTGPETIGRVWTDPVQLELGLAFSLPLLLIFLCHELGHYLACRWYRLDATPPYFLPLPLALGTLGAFIRIRSPLRTKRELFDVGVAGPLAGFVALAPFLVVGIARSSPTVIQAAPPDAPFLDTLVLYVPGQSLAMELVTRMVHGPLPPGVSLDLHPFALAAWVGLFATALNLLPLGQLDGGHILYAAFGARQRWLTPVLWLGLCAFGWLWTGWLMWAAVVLVLGLYHPPVVDEAAPLGPARSLLAAASLALLVLCFMPRPLSIVPVI